MGSVTRLHSHADQKNDSDDDMFATPEDTAGATVEKMNATARGRLKGFIDRIERLESEKDEVAEAIKEVKAEAKGEGFDKKIINRVIAIRKMGKEKHAEAQALIDLYLDAIGDD